MVFTALIAVLAFNLAHLPGLEHVGALSLALLMGIAARAFLHVPEHQSVGIGFSAKHLLRIGIVLLGVRLNFDLIMHAGPRILILAVSVILTGLLFITWLGRRAGLPGLLPVILAVDSSICGASAVAATAPVIRAKAEDMALVIPLCSLIGTGGVLALTAMQGILHLAPSTYGVLTGSTLHEVAQVMAAASAVPNALEPGAVTKLMRVLLLAPTVLLLGFLFPAPKGVGAGEPVSRFAAILKSIWFVFGFVLVGVLNTALLRAFPGHAETLAAMDQHVLTVATFLMGMAMAGLGLQVDFADLRRNGLRTAGVALAGWLVLVSLAAMEIYVMKL